MKKQIELLNGLSDGLRSAHSNTIRLYLITRHLKPDVPKAKKMLDKFNFRTSKIDLSTDLQDYFKALQVNQIEETLSKSDVEVSEYTVVDDDLPNKIYTYALNNALSFAEIVTTHLPNPAHIKSVSSLKGIKDNLWAYCIRTVVHGSPVYSFRKISKGKIGTDENDKNVFKKIQCAFNTKDSSLEILDKETISLDEKIDCIYFDSKFFVLKKGSFETMVGLEEEFKENAEAMLSEFKKSACIEGIEFIEAELAQNKPLLRRLASVARTDNYKNLDVGKVKKMQKIANRFGDQLRVKNDKVLIENSVDLKIFIRALCDYYKKGEITGNYYGSNAGKLLQPVEQQ